MDNQSNPAGTLKVTRIIWAALMLGQLGFLFVVLFVGPGLPEPDPQFTQLLFYMAAGMLIAAVPAAYIVRGTIYRGGQTDGVVAPPQYFTGNLIFLAMLEGVGLFALVGLMLNRASGPHLYVALAALLVQAVNFPTGGAMRGDDGIRPMHQRK